MDKLSRLRELMRERGVYAVMIGTEDFHNSEYVGEYFRLREYLSGFTGSAGTLVVTLSEARLWTDGRYFIQAAGELSGSGIELMRQGEKGVPTIEEYLASCPAGSTIGFDGRCVSIARARRLKMRLSPCGIKIDPTVDLGDAVWENRPDLSAEPVFALPDEACGKSRAEKLADIRAVMSQKRADAFFVSMLDEIAWTLNLRGGDIEYCPLFLAYMVILAERVILFVDPAIISGEIKAALAADNVEFQPYDAVYSYLRSYRGTLMLDPATASVACGGIDPVKGRVDCPSPITLMKATKNPAEIAAERSAHLRDGVAVTRFMKWLKSAPLSQNDGKITEISLAEKLEEFRKLDPDYLGQSFAPIMAYGEHGAIVHYSAAEETNAAIEPRGLLLSDTGGHYRYGTTDITRTYVLGELTDEEKRAFTLVMAGHLNLLDAKFPEGVRGSTLDYAAREPLWQLGMDFNHGTGHGVGFLLNVHEGPQRISRHGMGDAPLRAGMITSDEPGYYAEGKFGIRHESLILCRESEYAGFLEFEPLTLVPFDRDGIDKRYLTERQTALFNEYQKLVCDKLSPLLSKEEAEWLAEITRPV